MAGTTSGYKTQAIYARLKKSPDAVTFNRFDAAAMWQLFRGSAIDPNKFVRLDYRAFIQAATMAALEGSKGLAKIEGVMESAFAIPAQAGLANIVIKLFSSAVIKAYQWERDKLEAESGSVYRTAISGIAWGYKNVFEAIQNDLNVDDYL